MFRSFKKTKAVHAFKKGNYVPLENVEDPVFSQKMMGEGFAIESLDEKVYAPVSGVVTVVFPTLHAYGIQSKTNQDILIHLEINTVELNGQGFESFVKVGDKIKQGDLMARMDLKLIKENNYPLTSMCIVTSGENITLKDVSGEVTKDTEIFTIN